MIIDCIKMSGKRLQFVVGKGGVGKSAVTAALAIVSCAPDERVLAVELGRARGLSRLFGCEDRVGERPVEARPGLFVAAVDGESALAEYLSLVVPIRRLLKTVLATRLYSTFVAAAPGLKELMTVGKIWYENQQLDSSGGAAWDTIVVDAGASGHSLQYLQMPQAAAATFRSGLVHRESNRVAALLRDTTTTAVHVVATPEEMPLAEAADIVARLRGELSLPLGSVYVNRCRSVPPAGIEAGIAKLQEADDGRYARLLTTVRRRLSWTSIQEEGIAALERRIGQSSVRLPDLVAVEFGVEELERLAQSVRMSVENPS